MSILSRATWQTPRRTFGEIILTWFGVTTIIFFVYEQLNQTYGFSTWFTRWLMTLLVTGIVPLLIWYIKMNEQVSKK